MNSCSSVHVYTWPGIGTYTPRPGALGGLGNATRGRAEGWAGWAVWAVPKHVGARHWRDGRFGRRGAGLAPAMRGAGDAGHGDAGFGQLGSLGIRRKIQQPSSLQYICYNITLISKQYTDYLPKPPKASRSPRQTAAFRAISTGQAGSPKTHTFSRLTLPSVHKPILLHCDARKICGWRCKISCMGYGLLYVASPVATVLEIER